MSVLARRIPGALKRLQRRADEGIDTVLRHILGPTMGTTASTRAVVGHFRATDLTLAQCSTGGDGRCRRSLMFEDASFAGGSRPAAQARCPLREIGAGRYVSLADLNQGSVTVKVGDVVKASRSPQSVTTATRTNGTCTCRSKTPRQARTPTAPTPWCPATSTSPGGGAWPRGDSRELRTGDLIRALGQ
jgi:hypothetical protein